MAVVLVAFALVLLFAAIAGGATSEALRRHLLAIGGDFGSPSVAGHDTELRLLVARAESELPLRNRAA